MYIFISHLLRVFCPKKYKQHFGNFYLEWGGGWYGAAGVRLNYGQVACVDPISIIIFLHACIFILRSEIGVKFLWVGVAFFGRYLSTGTFFHGTLIS